MLDVQFQIVQLSVDGPWKWLFSGIKNDASIDVTSIDATTSVDVTTVSATPP